MSEPPGLTPKDFHDARAEITNQGVNGLLIINGGGAIALLGFLQAIWTQSPAFAKSVVLGIGIFAIGVLLAASINFLRYHTSFNFQSRDMRWYNIFRRAAFTFQYASLACFGLAILVVACGAWGQLPSTP